MIVHFLHGRTHVPLYATPGCGQTTSVGGPSIHHESYPQVLVRLFPKDRHHHFSHLTTSGSGHSTLFSDLFYDCDSKNPIENT